MQEIAVKPFVILCSANVGITPVEYELVRAALLSRVSTS